MDHAFSYGSGRWRMALVVVLALAPASVASAAKFWRNGVTTGNWNTATNWSSISASDTTTSGVPAAGEPVRIVHTDGVARTVTLDTNSPALGLTAIDLTGAGSTTDTLLIPNNNSLTVGAIGIGGYNGAAETNGRGALTQSNGALIISSGLDLVVGWGAGSTGLYTLNGGSVQASQSEFIGNKGTGTFNQSGGTNTILANGVGSFFVGQLAGSTGAYNLSGAGQLISNESEYIGNLGSGTFTQTGGANTINGTKDLILGNGAGGSGTYTISAGTLTANNNVSVGVSGTGTLNIQGTSSVNVTNAVNINGSSAVNLSGGTLRLNSTNASNRINFTSGKLQLGGARTIGTDPITIALLGASPVIPANKELAIEGDFTIDKSTSVNGGRLTLPNFTQLGFTSPGTLPTLSITNGGVVSIGSRATIGTNATVSVSGAGSAFSSYDLRVADANTDGKLTVTGGATVTTQFGMDVGSIAPSSVGKGTVTVSGPGSTLNLGTVFGSVTVGQSGVGTINIEDRAVMKTDFLHVYDKGTVNLNGGTLYLHGFDTTGNGKLNFNAGTIQIEDDGYIGQDPFIATYFGGTPTLPAGKGLSVDLTAYVTTPFVIDGGTFSAAAISGGNNIVLQRGTVNITNQALTISASGTLGSTLDLNDDMTVNVTLGTTNQGLVTGDGEIGGTFTNSATGELRGEPGKSLKLTGANNVNAGQINLFGGMVEFTQNLTNNSGALVTGNGTLKVGTLLTNSGIMNFSGLANIVGDVTNNAGAKIISSGGGPTTFHDDVINNGEIRTSAGSFTTFFGATSGSGTYTGTGTVNFEGDLKPGNSPAAISFGGNMALGVDAALKMELGGVAAGVQYDQVTVAGNLALDGALQITLINNFTPAAGNSFDLLNWSTLSGTFSSLSLPALASGLTWNTSQLYTTGTVSITSVGVSGDYNNNGVVDAADYILWRKGGPLLNEVDTPGTVNAADYTAWRARFGNTSGSGAGATFSAAVPEPSTVMLLILAAAGGVFPRNRDGRE